MQALFSLGVTVVAATSIMLFYVFDKSTTPEETRLIGDNMLKDLDDKGEKLKEAIDGKPSGFQMDMQEKQKGENENLKKMDEAKAAALVKQKEEAERQEKAKKAASQAKLKEEAGRQKKAKEAEATAQAKQKEEAERQKKVKDAAAQAKLKEESERQKKAKEAASQAKLKEETEHQKTAKEAASQAKQKEEATAQAKLKEEAERQKKAKEAAAQAKQKEEAQAKLKEESERQKKAKEAAAQAKLKEESERQKKAKEAAAQAKLKEEAEHQKKAREAAVQAKQKEEAEHQKKAKEAAAQVIQKEEAERLKKAKEAATQVKLKEESEHQKKAKEAAVQAKQKEEADHQKKAKEAAAQAKQKEEAEHQKKAKEAAAQVKPKEEAEHLKKAKEAATQAKQKEDAERQKKVKDAEAAVLAKQKEEAERQKKVKEGVQVTGNDGDETVHLAVVACGDRLEEPQVMIKSAVLLTQAKLHVHIFADDELRPLFKTQLDTWPSWVRNKFKYSLYEIQFPEGENADQWRKLFKLCASQRLFLPYVLKDLSAVLYVDTDILFMRPIENIWSFFKRFNSTQIAALTPEHESPNAGWYNRFARHPYYGKLGVNSGVMLMNLTRMRQERWMEHILPYFREYKLRITWGDQDLINIFFHFYPEKLYVYPCNWNYRPDHCMYGSDCKQAEDRGVSVLHGNRGSYHNDKQPTFKAIYQAVRDFRFGDDFETKLLGEMRKRMKNVEGTPCGRLPYVFLSQLERQIKLLKEKSAKKPVVEEDMKVRKQVADSKEKEVKTEKREERDVAGVSKEEIPAKKNEKEAAPAKAPVSPVMHLAVVACGNRFAETLILLKSAVLLTRAKIFFHIFADDDLQPKFKQKLSQWPANVLCQVTYEVRPIQFPSDNTAAWKKLFKPCASQRLFLPNILEDVDALLYIDTDVLFFTPLEDVWAHFDAFNSTQLAALAGEMEDTSNSWYTNFARHPYYPPLGVNSGVMLMNLTRMRQVDWLSHIIPYYEEYKFRITWGDQDLINIYFHYFPEQLYVYSCKWNYRHDHCIYMDVCKAVKETGVSVLHGCRRIFQNDKEPAFRAIYLAMEEHQFGDDLGKLLESLKTKYRTAAHTNCGQMEKHFFQQLERHIAARKRDKA